MKPVLNEKVDVGGCVGKITEINDGKVMVRGTYHYPDGEYDEHWDLEFDLDEFEKAKKCERNREIWDLSGVFDDGADKKTVH